jgi:hypothetical protein
MISRIRVRRTGVAFVAMGIVLSTVNVNPAGEIPGAFADQVTAIAASPAPSASPAAAAASPEPAATAQAVAASVTAPEKAPEGGDLTHLVFTATDGLSASLVAPADDDVAGSTAASLEVQTVAGAGVELKVGDAVIPFSRIGKRTVDTKSGVTRYTYYGVALQPGPNSVALTPLGAVGLRGETTVHRVFGPGRPATVSLVASGPLRADGTRGVIMRSRAASLRSCSFKATPVSSASRTRSRPPRAPARRFR